MTSAISVSGRLNKLYAEESARIEQEFVSRGDGLSTVAQRAALLDQIVLQLWERSSTQHSDGLESLALAAVGGYGRKCLFPFSDVDLLFLFADSAAEKR